MLDTRPCYVLIRAGAMKVTKLGQVLAKSELRKARKSEKILRPYKTAGIKPAQVGNLFEFGG